MDNPSYRSDRDTATKSAPPALPKIPEREMLLLVRFAKLAKVMREVQKHYFDGDRSIETIRQAKDLERRVDKAIAWVLTHAAGNPTQGKLFDNDPEQTS